jgi:hypothetical protein
MWGGGHAESCGAGATVMDSLEGVIVQRGEGAERGVYAALLVL